MRRRIALKRLSASDLTLFEYHYRVTPGTKQKAFNLDRSIFLDELYPSLPDSLDVGQDRVPVDLSVFGPGGAGLENLQRKILKQKKNWRLNGELIYNPEDNADRYSDLIKGDLAIMEFFGEPRPYALRMCLLGQKYAADKPIHDALQRRYVPLFTSQKAMLVIPPDDLASLLEDIGLSEDHPIYELANETALEDAAQGGLEGVRKLRRRRRGRGVGREEFERGRRNAEQVGRLGEEVLNGWLEDEVSAGRLTEVIWESDCDAVAPYDFRLVGIDGRPRKIDAKSTQGDFANPIHVSIAELLEMSQAEEPYDLYRLYDVAESGAKLRICHDLRDFAKEIVEKLELLPAGVMADGVSIKPDVLNFDVERNIEVSTGNDDDG